MSDKFYKPSVTLAAEVLLAQQDYNTTAIRVDAGNRILEYIQNDFYKMEPDQFAQFAEEHLQNLSELALLARIIIENQEAIAIRAIIIPVLKGGPV